MVERRAPHFIEKIGVMNGTGPRCKLEQKAALGLELTGFLKAPPTSLFSYRGTVRERRISGPRPLYSVT